MARSDILPCGGEEGSMIARRGVSTMLAAGALALSGCGGNEASYRYRMTVEVETPQGLKAGSSVQEIVAERQEQVLSEARPMISTVKGEAVAVDLPSGPLFVLLQMPDARTTYISAVTYALAPDLREGGWEPFWKAVNRLGGWSGSATGEMPREDWPVMVRFHNINDPKSVERVDPEAVGVKRILLETTSDDVTTGIEKKLPPWFQKLASTGSRLDGDNSIAVSANPSSVAGQFSPGDFSTIYNGGK
jgi:hypothetical protein